MVTRLFVILFCDPLSRFMSCSGKIKFMHTNWETKKVFSLFLIFTIFSKIERKKIRQNFVEVFKYFFSLKIGKKYSTIKVAAVIVNFKNGSFFIERVCETSCR
jgi:hypothetical protein